ncbi:peptide deformylase [Nodosilinea sp. LEGE 07088]|uniref:peptide deformylase n=1 Tax=Nodosilinea sp. LEGE 07088 TaxID=2777968 RepID=UPI00187F3AD2|nr:peptide deformylase [Nodosilinea sp. LEGE 07088]MBE9140053.1 peptide deformylase [Nodosilinea sp. LEGE 07088]
MSLNANPPAYSTPVLTYEQPLLHQVAQPVDDIAAPAVQALIDQLLTTVQTANGVGIAAPQLGSSLRVIIVASRPNLRYPQAPTMAPTVLINPHLVTVGNERELGWEGCLSVPGVRGQVWRHRVVDVTYCDRNGRPQNQVWQGFVARIVQHEIDHLDGTVFLDRVPVDTDLISEDAYQSMVIDGLGEANR